MKKVILTTTLILCTVVLVQAQNLSVASIQFGTDVQNREVIGADSVFANTVGKIYCFTHVTGAEDTTTVTHIWYHDNAETAQVDLTIRSADWRTWSSKNILESWTGKWSVDVLGPNGEILETKQFTIEGDE